jgi:uncharacterized membrane protein YkoI
MRMKWIAAIALAASLASVGPALAQGRDSLGANWREQQDEARQGVQAGRLLPMPQVIEIVRRQTPGRLLDAGLEQAGGRPVYRVRWAADGGRRIDYLVDAQTGAILQAEGR